MSDFEPHHITSGAGNKPGFISSFSSSAQGRPHTPTLAGKKRRMSKGKASPILKRAVSTPQMSGLLPHETGGLSPSALDKRRNKLGYQRISIACGHCRRRKIRCVLSETDEHGRCQNCIRLKKDCVFYPVDSAGGAESRAQQKSGLGSKASSVISNSPSERKPGAPGESEREHEFGRFPPLASNAPSDLTSISSGSGLGISTGTSMTTPEFAFDSGAGAREGWHPGMYQQPESATSDASTTGSWRVQDSPRVGDFSGFSSDGQSSGVYGSYHYPPPRQEYGMQPPLRSMSYGNIEPSLGGYQPPSAASSVEFARPIVPAQYSLPSVDASQTPTTSSMLDPAIAPVVTEPMPQYGGLYSPTQWSYYQQTQQPQHSAQPMGVDYSRHDSLNMQWYQSGPVGMDEQTRQHQHRHQQQQQQQNHQQWQPQQQQQQQHHLMPPPGSGYNKGHSPG